MDTLTAILGALTLILGLILSGIAFGNRIIKGIKAQVREVLIDVGLIRPGPGEASWPNAHNLPDAIEAIEQRLNDHIEAHVPLNKGDTQ